MLQEMFRIALDVGAGHLGYVTFLVVHGNASVAIHCKEDQMGLQAQLLGHGVRRHEAIHRDVAEDDTGYLFESQTIFRP